MAPPFRPKRAYTPSYPALPGFRRQALPGVLRLALLASFVTPIAACGAAPNPDYPYAELAEDGVFTVTLESGDVAEVQVYFYAQQVVLDELLTRMTEVEEVVQSVLATQRCDPWEGYQAEDELRSLVTGRLTSGAIERVEVVLVTCGE